MGTPNESQIHLVSLNQDSIKTYTQTPDPVATPNLQLTLISSKSKPTNPPRMKLSLQPPSRVSLRRGFGGRSDPQRAAGGQRPPERVFIIHP